MVLNGNRLQVFAGRDNPVGIDGRGYREHCRDNCQKPWSIHFADAGCDVFVRGNVDSVGCVELAIS